LISRGPDSRRVYSSVTMHLAINCSFCSNLLGEYVTLGAWERLDIRAIVAYLREEGATSTIAFWGRSMGAVAALLYADEDNMLDAMVLDSPFASLRM